MSFPRENFRPGYDNRTSSDVWHRQSEFHGMEADRRERQERCGLGYEFLPPEPLKPPVVFPSHDQVWWERAKDLYLDDRHKPLH